MALDHNQIIRFHVNQLVNALVPEEFGLDYIQGICSSLSAHLTLGKPSYTPSTQMIINDLKTQFSSRGLNQQWMVMQNLLNELSRYKSPESIAKYLLFLNGLRGANSTPSHTPSHSHISSPKTPGHAPPAFSSFSTTLYDAIQPYTQSVPDLEILTYLSYSLMGLDSKLLTFGQNDTVRLPTSLNVNYSNLLAETLEAGLLYKWLQEFVQEKRGKLNSPIKTAFTLFLELELNNYVSTVTSLFNTNPSSLVVVYDHMYEPILKLRFLYTIAREMDAKDGYNFLILVHGFTKYGDDLISSVATHVFSEMAIPYYDLLEHWITKGELVDTNDELFIKFNASENHINDIIEFISAKIPAFITSLNKSMGYKIFQIGKHLIFLAKYCQDLKWVNDYYMKYSQFISQTHRGLKSMDMNLFSSLVNQQYEEIINHFTTTCFSQNMMFKHLVNLKNFYFMHSGDFIESIIKQGATLFNEPSSTLTSNQLSQVLMESISQSSLRTYPTEFTRRLDARILDLSHGTIGWEVFTLEYKVNDLPIDNILNYNQALLEYLRMFNFLWKLRHLHYALNESFLDNNNIWKNDLKSLLRRYTVLTKNLKKDANYALSLRDTKIIWLIKSFKTISIIRHQLIAFVTSLVGYFSFDVIEDAFQKLIIEELFRTNRNKSARVDPKFLRQIDTSSGIFGIKPSLEKHNMKEHNLDELTEIHSKYLRAITHSKLLDEKVSGKVSGESYVKTIYAILDIILTFVKGSDEFSSLVVNYVSIINLGEDEAMDDDLDTVEEKLRTMIHKLYHQVFLQDFRSTQEVFTRDLKNDLDLKELCRRFK